MKTAIISEYYTSVRSCSNNAYLLNLVSFPETLENYAIEFTRLERRDQCDT